MANSIRPQRYTRVGLQAAALGWDDPFTPGLCEKWWRTGEGRGFVPQDPVPTPAVLVGYLKGIGVNFYLHPVIPIDANYRAIASFAEETGIDLLIGNEMGTINGSFTTATNRFDPDLAAFRADSESGRVLGVVYDETEHLQIHPDQYARRFTRGTTPYQWGEPNDCGICMGTMRAMAATVVGRYAPRSVLHEFVFPSLVHTLAAGGFVPTPKLLKESWTALHLAVAAGAALQYGRNLGVCVDLWGPDVGPWFTRLWSSPGHSPREFASILEFAGALAPSFLYVENMDSLCRSTGETLVDTEFGEVFRSWRRRTQGDPMPVCDPATLRPTIAVVYADRGDVAVGHPNPLHPGGETGRSFFEAMHLLTHGFSPVNASTLHFSGIEVPAGRFARNEDALADLPKPWGEAERRVHRPFCPMNNAVVFDEYVDLSRFPTLAAVIVVGDIVPSETIDRVVDASRTGADCVVARGTLPAGSRPTESRHLIVVDSVLDPRSREMLSRHLGAADLFVLDFQTRRVEARPADDPDRMETRIVED